MKFDQLRHKLDRGTKLNVLFLNDIGFQFGAGIALLRQIQSFLLLGHDVRGLCWTQGAEESKIPVAPQNAEGTWLGMRLLSHLHDQHGFDESQIQDAVVSEIKSTLPDVVIAGNMHNSRLPLTLLSAIQDLGPLVIAYMHDCFFITGRCTHPFDCSLYKSGCNEQCATSQEYPSLPKDRISGAWRMRQDLFCNARVSLAANSCWTLGMAKGAMPHAHCADVVYLGLDHHLFKPINRALARRLLGLPEDQLIILGGAVNVSDPHKGGHAFKEVVSKLSRKATFLVFGAESMELKGVRATGLIRDYRKMPLLYSAADLYFGTSVAESFGQTYLEAAACALPVVAFRVGGIPEVARHHVNARLIDGFNVKQYLEEMEFFIQNPDEREAYGAAGRAMVEAEFTLEQQAQRWERYLISATAC